VTETTQTLADGNHIRRSTRATLFRDSEGRTRREQNLGEIGPMVAASGQPVQTIMISDPVAGATYILNSQEKVAHKLPHRVGGGFAAKQEAEAKARAEERGRSVVHGLPAVAGVAGTAAPETFGMRIEGTRIKADGKNYRQEPLGTQMIEGVAAEGTRSTMTIPAGAMGNERPIEIVNERWYSPQLKTTVMTKSTDPRVGETTYTLKNVRLAEPDSSLFAVPPDYSLQ
jgi:hypothetical protein